MIDTHRRSPTCLVVNAEVAEDQSRLTAMRLVSLTLRLMERWRSLVDDNDSALIMMAVALINTEGFTRGDLVQQGIADLKDGASPDLLRMCNISSVAAAAGLNRETARRKIARLVELELLGRSEDGHVYLHPQLRIRDDMVRTVHCQLAALAKAADEFLRDGTFKVTLDQAAAVETTG